MRLHFADASANGRATMVVVVLAINPSITKSVTFRRLREHQCLSLSTGTSMDTYMLRKTIAGKDRHKFSFGGQINFITFCTNGRRRYTHYET